MSEGTVVRDYKPSDFEEIKRIHEQGGLDYKTPALNTTNRAGETIVNPLFIVNKVLTVDDKIVAAVLWRIEAETYLLLDKESGLDPEQNMAVLRGLQVEGLAALWKLGIDDAVCWVPQEIEKTFAKRLTQLGWKRDREGWHSWSRKTEIK